MGKAVRNTVLIEFIRVYGALIACACMIIALAAALYACVAKVKRLESRVRALEETMLSKLEEIRKDAQEDQKKQRKLINEGMAGLTETVTRAIYASREKKTD